MNPEIQKALDDCEAAFAAHLDAPSLWCCHHEILWEKVLQHPTRRINYILLYKPEDQQLVRFQNFRPCLHIAEVLAIFDKDFHDRFTVLNTEHRHKNGLLVEAGMADDSEPRLELMRKYTKAAQEICQPYYEKCMPFYKQDVPNGTWNGVSIFNNQPRH